jgi:transposase
MTDKLAHESGSGGRREFDETFKRHVVELTISKDRPLKQIAAEVGISQWTLYRWRSLYAPRPRAARKVDEQPESPQEKDEEIRRLRAEVVRLQEREIILKRSVGILSETPGSGIPALKR